MKLIHHIRDYLPSLFVIVFGSIIFLLIARSVYNNRANPPFKPVTSLGLVWQGCTDNCVFHVGQVVSIKDGICNNSKDTLKTSSVIGVQEQGVAGILARNIKLFPPSDLVPTNSNSSATPDLTPLPPGCTPNQITTIPLPTTIPTGKWRAYVALDVYGTQMGQRQSINILSAPFTVVP